MNYFNYFFLYVGHQMKILVSENFKLTFNFLIIWISKHAYQFNDRSGQKSVLIKQLIVPTYTLVFYYHFCLSTTTFASFAKRKISFTGAHRIIEKKMSYLNFFLYTACCVYKRHLLYIFSFILRVFVNHHQRDIINTTSSHFSFICKNEAFLLSRNWNSCCRYGRRKFLFFF